ncbi:intein-containing atp-dependent helicase brm precursor [Anaeramoeba flamelloides]|uniref:Intein-containing atp-dependent helicase brm n=1 Tax=Anaeramoeba flamelloides TaxID=1746091 RepID=A0AAV7YD02_9EUKA|nr:intein-containing atp-dependent helicase brm precursor [Anaeramoeba flamelloides]
MNHDLKLSLKKRYNEIEQNQIVLQFNKMIEQKADPNNRDFRIHLQILKAHKKLDQNLIQKVKSLINEKTKKSLQKSRTKNNNPKQMNVKKQKTVSFNHNCSTNIPKTPKSKTKENKEIKTKITKETETATIKPVNNKRKRKMNDIENQNKTEENSPLIQETQIEFKFKKKKTNLVHNKKNNSLLKTKNEIKMEIEKEKEKKKETQQEYKENENEKEKSNEKEKDKEMQIEKRKEKEMYKEKEKGKERKKEKEIEKEIEKEKEIEIEKEKEKEIEFEIKKEKEQITKKVVPKFTKKQLISLKTQILILKYLAQKRSVSPNILATLLGLKYSNDNSTDIEHKIICQKLPLTVLDEEMKLATQKRLSFRRSFQSFGGDSFKTTGNENRTGNENDLDNVFHDDNDQDQIVKKKLYLVSTQQQIRKDILSEIGKKVKHRTRSINRIRRSRQINPKNISRSQEFVSQLNNTKSIDRIRNISFLHNVIRTSVQFHNFFNILKEKRKKINDCIIRYHLNIEKRKETRKLRAERYRLNILKKKDYQTYLHMIKSIKKERLLSIISQTDNYLIELAHQIENTNQASESLSEELLNGMEKKIESEPNQMNTEGVGVVEKTGEDEIEKDEIIKIGSGSKYYYSKIHEIKEKVKQPTDLSGGELKYYQLQGLEWLVSLYNNNHNGILADEMGLGKAQPIDCKILTPSGWNTFSKIKINDEIINSDGEISKITGIYPQGYQKVWKMNFSDGSSTQCSLEHLWKIYFKKQTNEQGKRKYKIHSKIINLKKLLSGYKQNKNNLKKYFFPVTKPIKEFNGCKNKKIFSPFVLGMLLTKPHNRLFKDNELKLINKKLPLNLQLVFNKKINKYQIIFQHSVTNHNNKKINPDLNDLINQINRILLNHEKNYYIPKEYLFSNVQSRLEFYFGILNILNGKYNTTTNNNNNNGTKEKNDKLKQYLTIKSKSKQFIQDLFFLLKSIQIPTIINNLKNNLTIINNNGQSHPTKKTFFIKLHSIEEIGIKKCICISVNSKDRLYITDDLILTHNTIQTISLLTYLFQYKNNKGPTLILGPLSILNDWSQQFQKWSPKLKTIIYWGDKNKRHTELLPTILSKNDNSANIVLTTYDLTINDEEYLSSINWEYLIIDEGHRLKNNSGKLFSVLSTKYNPKRKLILTGTPLQNNLNELWSLLNFLLPQIFQSSEQFEMWFNSPFQIDDKEDVKLTQEEQFLIIQRLHQILMPFLLRRLKVDVEKLLPKKIEKILYCPMTAWQKKLYLDISVNNCFGKYLYNNPDQKLRKICSHPFALIETLDGNENKLINNMHDKNLALITSSGKFLILDNILEKLKLFNHRTLIFCQFKIILTLLEKMLAYRKINYLRLDGSIKSDQRIKLINDFNQINSKYFVFLLSTRVGGLGLNLQTADTVILFDSDWNPQMDNQAQSRVHRIGQKMEVRIIRFITNGSIENKILRTINHKMDIHEKVIEAGKFNKNAKDIDRKKKLHQIFSDNSNVNNNSYQNQISITSLQEINKIISRSVEEYRQFEKLDLKKKSNNTFLQLIPEKKLPKWLKNSSQLKIENLLNPIELGRSSSGQSIRIRNKNIKNIDNANDQNKMDEISDGESSISSDDDDLNDDEINNSYHIYNNNFIVYNDDEDDDLDDDDEYIDKSNTKKVDGGDNLDIDKK